MNEDTNQIEQLRDQAADLPYGPTKVALLEEAVRRADTLNDLHYAYELRRELMTAATFSGRPDVLLVAFAWVRSYVDQHPEKVDHFGFLWEYKWVVGKGPDFPEISRAQIDEMFGDFERRVLASRYSMFTVLAKRRDADLDLNDPQAAKIAQARLKQHSPDALSDCAVCRVGHDCRYWDYLGDWPKAVEIGEQAIHRKLRCEVQPLGILCRLLVPLVRLGRIEQAWEYQRKGQRLLARSGHPMGLSHFHIRFLAAIGELTKAIKLVERHLPVALTTPDLSDRFNFVQAARLATLALAASGKTDLRMRLPESPLQASSRDKVALADLNNWFAELARAIAIRFDDRNGNPTMEQWVRDLPQELEQLQASGTAAKQTSP